ncbi:hypothetical protein ACHRVW_11375 [Flavobacterium collinsii]|jgi:hypothetical protein|uniref:hypothetical protein n=1 Tax=Flavobacterium collinsii TaxID=1114861 RepID=UPI0022C6384E|nr:hypothetical protein [Flavobacterium collinsii]GIQ57095.1 hypothetical protein Flavo103_02310 [Flavobacterium collinsii]
MKYTLLFIFLTSFHSFEAKVFICGPTGAKKYHYNENCRGLSSCRNEVTKVSVKHAQGLGLSLCGWED